MTEHDPRFDDAPAVYLLGALDPDEALAFEAHLEGCPACRRELAELKPAADALPAGVVQYRAPEPLHDRLLATVRSEAALLHATGSHADLPARAPRRRLAGWLARPPLALAATLLVLVVGALAGVALLGGSDARTVQASLKPDGATVRLIVRADSRHSTLTAAGLPAAGAGRVYQVWLRRGDGAPRPTDALFVPNASGRASVDVPGAVEGDDVLVTSEPAGGSPAPTRDPIIAVQTA